MPEVKEIRVLLPGEKYNGVLPPFYASEKAGNIIKILEENVPPYSAGI